MFFRLSDKIGLFLIGSVFSLMSVIAQDVKVITIPLNKTIPYDNREIYGGFIELNNSSPVQIQFTNINSSLSFIILQVHSQYENVTLYNNKSVIFELNGTNIGMISLLKEVLNKTGKPDIFFLRNPNEHVTVTTYVSVHGYTTGDPYPGGCNAEWRPLVIHPYLQVTTSPSTIRVAASAPSIDPYCNAVEMADVTFYMMYLAEMNFKSDVYFDGIRRMMSLKSIMEYGVEIPIITVGWTTRRLLSAYSGTSVIVVAVARHYNNSELYSVYVPNHSYGCPEVNKNGCKNYGNFFFDLLCTLLFLVGLFVSFFGHRFFKTAMFCGGFFSGFILTYILINIIPINIGVSEVVIVSALFGISLGVLWLLFWRLYGIPIAAVMLPSLNVGFLLACVFYYKLPATCLYITDDFKFWSVFIMVTLLISLTMAFVTYSASILSCSFLGGFCVMYAFDYYLGSNLKYIIENTVRRTFVPNFNVTILAPPFMSSDIVVTLIWVIIALSGWTFQHWHNRSRPPFPPPRSPRSITAPTMYGAISDFTRRLFPRANVDSNPARASIITANEQTGLLSDGH